MSGGCGYAPQAPISTAAGNEAAQPQPRHKPWWEGFYERRNAGLDNKVMDQPPIGMEACWPSYSNANLYGDGGCQAQPPIGMEACWPSSSNVCGDGGCQAQPWVNDVHAFGMQNEYVQVSGSGPSLAGSGAGEPAQPNHQDTNLSADCTKEVQLHIHILTSYFSHTLRHQSKDATPARAQAVQHWIDCAQQWENYAPEDWKARLPTTPPSVSAVQGMMCRQVRIHAMIETQRRRSQGMNWAPSGAWQADINTTALKEQVKLMKSWTRMFNGTLQDLQFNFPLLHGAMQESQTAGGWNHPLGADNKANIDGL